MEAFEQRSNLTGLTSEQIYHRTDYKSKAEAGGS